MKHSFLWTMAVIVISTLFIGASCADGPKPLVPEGTVGQTCDRTDAALTAVTFNTGLGPGMIEYSSPRAPQVAAALGRTQYDVLCLQEAWVKRDQDAIVAALGLPPQNVFVTETAGLGETGTDTCSGSQVDFLLSCTDTQCKGVPSESLTLCAMDKCAFELAAVYMNGKNCVNCLAAMAGKSSLAIADVCTHGGASRIQGGRNGVILASRWPLIDREVINLPASGANRVALLARIAVPGATEPVELACTHLSSDAQIPPAHSGYATWIEEQRAQLKMIDDRLRLRAGTRPTLLIGDVNTGPKVGTLDAEAPAVWGDVMKYGYVSPAASIPSPWCTICGENTLRGKPGGAGNLIDHVLVRDPVGGTDLVPACADRMFDAPVNVIGYSGGTVLTDLSDHYGTRVKFRLKVP